MMKRQVSFLLGISLLAFPACTASKKVFLREQDESWSSRQLPDEKELLHTLFLIGDVGEGPEIEVNPVLQLLANQLVATDEKGSVAFLGNNIPKINQLNAANRAKAETALRAQLAVLENSAGKAWFLAGENEWGRGLSDGWEMRRWAEEFVETNLEDPEAWVPGGGCGTPFRFKLDKDRVFLFIDTQWWLENWERNPQVNQDCALKDRFGFLGELEYLLKKHHNDQLVILMHHPLFSNGPHGGSFPLHSHLLPLPGVGTLLTLYRQLGGSSQDLSHRNYLRLRQEILQLLEKKPVNDNVIFVAAHDHSLQYIVPQGSKSHFIVSGSGSKAGFARGNKNAVFVEARPGFAKLLFYRNHEVWLEFWTLATGPGQGELSFRKKIVAGKPSGGDRPAGEEFEPLPDSVTVSASAIYNVGRLRKVGFGNRYRKAWQTPVTVPVFNFETSFKGFEIVKLGGGMSSKSLRLQAPDGKEYVLRSVNKNVGKGLPEQLRRTVAEGIVQDLKSGSHPYGAFVLPSLAEAAGIYHANPQLYFLPRQPGLGAFNDAVAGELYLFEERPDDEVWATSEQFDHSPDIVSYTKLLEELRDSPKNQVDGPWALRSRLFDQWIHDYDRHDDQWRWASFPQENGTTLYRPIPRDRDQAFFDLRGVVPFFLSRRWLQIQQRGFQEKITDVPGQAYPGSRFDRTYLTQLDHDEWMRVALDLQTKLTDEVIEQAFDVWPPQIYALNAPHIISVLKARRDHMLRHAEELYFFYAKYVDVVGTDKRELFEVQRLPNGDIEVTVFHLNKEREILSQPYHRLFRFSETEEIRLYGLGNDDSFRLVGEGRKGIRVRIIGGEGNDDVQDESVVKGHRKRTVVYDTPSGMEIAGRGEIEEKLAFDLKINEFDRFEFYHDRYFPLLTFGSTVDDGFFLGGGVNLMEYRFRKRPYGVKYHLFGRFSTNTAAMNLDFSADFVEVLGQLDFNPSIRFDQPTIFNFFGLGNDTKDTPERSRFNWVRLEKFRFQPLLKKRWYNGRNSSRFGPFFENVEVEERPDRITDTGLFEPDDLTGKRFMGLLFRHEFNDLDQQAVPRSGIKLNLAATYFRNLSRNQSYAQFEGSFTNFITFGLPVEVTLGFRIGAATFTNDKFMFYHANNLGGNNYLRGFRNNRFSGRSLFYQNTDLRIKLFYSHNKFMPFEFGLLGSFDYGRVWYRGSEGEGYHTGWSPGLWFTPYKFAAVTAYYTFTEAQEQDTYTVRVGFFF